MTTGIGPTIIRGPKGEAGSQIIVDSGTPTDDVGGDGDLYIDSGTNNYFQKIDGSWQFKGNFGGTGGGLYLDIDMIESEKTIVHNFGRFPVVDILEITFISGSDGFTFDGFRRDAFGTEEDRIRKPDDEYILKHPDQNTIIVQKGTPGHVKVILTA